MHRIIIICCILCLTTSVFGQNSSKNIKNLIETLNPLDSIQLKSFKTDTTVKHAKSFYDYSLFLRSRLEEESSLSGKVIVGSTGNDTRENDLWKLNGGINLKRGTFPRQFRFNSNIGLTVNNKEFQENVSDFSISYDWHPKRTLPLEAYVFLDRSTNGFLGIDNRYLFGGGIILASYSDNLIEHKNNIEKKLSSFDLSGNQPVYKIQFQGTGSTSRLKTSKLSKAEIQQAQKIKEELRLSNKKKYSKFRVGCLIGAMIELEKGSASDSLEVNDSTMVFFEDNFTGTVDFRMVLRPTLDFRFSKNVRLKLRPYIVLPAFWDATQEILALDNSAPAIQRFDFRIDARNELEIKANDEMTFSFNYRLLYDGAPQASYVSHTDGNFYLLSSEDLHHIFSVNLTLTLK